MAATEDETVPYSKSSTATRFFLTGGWVCGRAAAHMKRKNNETNPMRIMRDILMLLFTGGIRGRYFRKTLAELKGGYKDFATAGCTSAEWGLCYDFVFPLYLTASFAVR